MEKPHLQIHIELFNLLWVNKNMVNYQLNKKECHYTIPSKCKNSSSMKLSLIVLV